MLEAQEFLAGEGFYGIRKDERGREVTVKPDGKWGEGTRQAIAAYRTHVDNQLKGIGRQLTEVGKDLETQEGRQRGLERDQRTRAIDQDLPL